MPLLVFQHINLQSLAQYKLFFSKLYIFPNLKGVLCQSSQALGDAPPQANTRRRAISAIRNPASFGRLTSDPQKLIGFVAVGREGQRTSRDTKGREQQVGKRTSYKGGKEVPRYLTPALRQARDS